MIVESSQYPAFAKDAVLATQSGPLLVERADIHPVFDQKSTSRLIRNGVGVRGTGEFQISPGDRIAQLLLVPVSHAVPRLADALDDSTRGEGGFGSSGF